MTQRADVQTFSAPLLPRSGAGAGRRSVPASWHFLKRATDVALGGAALLALSPLVALAAAVTKCTRTCNRAAIMPMGSCTPV